MSDLLCVPCRPGWQVGISERRKLCRPRRCIAETGYGPHSASWKLAATGDGRHPGRASTIRMSATFVPVGPVRIKPPAADSNG